VFGNEATGISDEIRQWKGKELYINIDGVESLSVANAAAIGMYKYK
jgi:tRNA G18 (ribose-2'-O)-methylase SpoU